MPATPSPSPSPSPDPFRPLGRPLLPQDVDAAYEHYARAACATINVEQREAPPQLFFVQLSEEPGVIARCYTVDDDAVAHLLNKGHPGRNALRDVIAAVLGDTLASPFPLRKALQLVGVRADIAVQVTKAWAAEEVPPDDPLRDMQPSQRADRVEMLTVLVHVKGHTCGQAMRISNQGGRRHVDYRALTEGGTIVGGELALQQWDDVPEALR